MEATEKKLSHEESMLIINSMISVARNQVTENGFHFLLWGVLVIIASLTQYFWLLAGGGNESNLVWMIMPALGVPAALIYEWRRSKVARVETHLESGYGFVWLAFGVTLGLAIFTAVYNNIQPMAFVLMLVGLATFASGGLYRFMPLLAGGVVFWIAALIAVFVKGPDSLLLNAAATFIGYIVPGVLLWRNYKKAS